MTMDKLPADRLKEMFEIRSDGQLIRRIRTARTNRAGDVAGTKNVHGYIVVSIAKRTYYVHRIIMAMIAGEWPDKQVDHANGDRADNRPENLRLASNAENQQNARIKARNSSGVKGVYWHSQNQNWYAQIWANKRAITVGSFDRIEDAALAVAEARTKHHGEFARTA